MGHSLPQITPLLKTQTELILLVKHIPVWMITGDATKGHQALSFDREWTGDESTYASCPGEGCPVWIYVNGGTVDAIVQQYLP